MMDYKRLLAGAMIFSMLAATATGCSDKKSSSDSSSSSSSSSSESQTEAASATSAESSESSSAEEELSTEASSEAATAPVPVEASGDNVVTFDDGKFDLQPQLQMTLLMPLRVRLKSLTFRETKCLNLLIPVHHVLTRKLRK